MSVTSAAASKAECKAGGTKFTAASGTSKACNGEEGKEGSPWVAGGTLPAGKSEKGTWSVQIGSGGLAQTAISFVIPLPAAPTLVYLKEGEKTTNCPGTEEAPEAKEGFLCVYNQPEQGTVALLVSEAHTFGARLLFESATEGIFRNGSWAVTAG